MRLGIVTNERDEVLPGQEEHLSWGQALRDAIAACTWPENGRWVRNLDIIVRCVLPGSDPNLAFFERCLIVNKLPALLSDSDRVRIEEAFEIELEVLVYHERRLVRYEGGKALEMDRSWEVKLPRPFYSNLVDGQYLVVPLDTTDSGAVRYEESGSAGRPGSTRWFLAPFWGASASTFWTTPSGAPSTGRARPPSSSGRGKYTWGMM